MHRNTGDIAKYFWEHQDREAEGYIFLLKPILILAKTLLRFQNDGTVPPEQHGLWDHNCVELVLKKTLFNYTMRQKRWAASGGSFDAHTCYDRGVHNYWSM